MSDEMADQKRDGTSWREEMNNVVLPEWITELIPPKPEVRVISRAADDTFTVSDEAGNALATGFETFVEANATVDSRNDEFEVQVDPNVFNELIEDVGGIVFLEPFADGSRQAITFGHYENSMAVLKDSYSFWIEKMHPLWLSDTTDWVNAHNWLVDHPVFWTRYDTEPTLDWITDVGLSAMRTTVVTAEDGSTEVWLEHGPHHGPDFTACAKDHELDVVGSTFEESYVKLARKVHQYYDKTGVARCSELNCTGSDGVEEEEVSENFCQKHVGIHNAINQLDVNDPSWGVRVEELWLASNAS